MKSMKLLTKETVVTALSGHVLNLRAELPMLFIAVFWQNGLLRGNDDVDSRAASLRAVLGKAGTAVLFAEYFHR